MGQMTAGFFLAASVPKLSVNAVPKLSVNAVPKHQVQCHAVGESQLR